MIFQPIEPPNQGETYYSQCLHWKEENFKTKYLCFYLTKLDKEEQLNSKCKETNHQKSIKIINGQAIEKTSGTQN